MEVGQYVHSTTLNKTVQIIELLDSQATAIVETLRRNEPNHHVPLTDLKPLTLPQAKAEATPPTPRQQKRINFNAELFSDHGTTLTCYCGAVTRKIPTAYIKAWGTDNTNAALNYVISLCAYCRPSPPTFSNATQRYFTDGTDDQ